MNGPQFDGITRVLARNRSRRAVLSGLGVAALTGVRPVSFAAAKTTAPSKFTVTASKSSADFSGVSVDAINDSGVAVGFANTKDAKTGAVAVFPIVFEKGNIKLLGKKGGQGSALAINNRGHVAGILFTSGGTPAAHPALFTTSGSTDLYSLRGPGIATAINNSDHVVGSSALSSDPNAVDQAFVFAKGKLTVLGGLVDGATSTAAGINDAGLIVGSAGTQTGTTQFAAGSHAVSWKDGKITDLGTLPGGDISIAAAVNASGQIAGSSTTGPDQSYAGPGTQAVLWKNGEMSALPFLDGSSACLAASINASGWITGICTAPGSNSMVDTIAMLWVDGVAIDLNALAGGEWTIKRAYGINASGQISCTATDGGGSNHALILTPAGS